MCNFKLRVYYTIEQPTYFNKKGGNRATIKHIPVATPSLKCDGRKKLEQSIPYFAQTNCVAIATRPTVAIPFLPGHESTLAVHSANLFVVSNLIITFTLI